MKNKNKERNLLSVRRPLHVSLLKAPNLAKRYCNLNVHATHNFRRH